MIALRRLKGALFGLLMLWWIWVLYLIVEIEIVVLVTVLYCFFLFLLYQGKRLDRGGKGKK